MNARYWLYEEMVEQLRAWQARYPHLMRYEAIGDSPEQRRLWAVAITDGKTGGDREKSAVLVDANIHAGEVAGNAVAMFWIGTLLEQYGTDEEITALLQEHSVYVIPRIAVDGAERYLTTPDRLRSAPRLYPHSTPKAGWVAQDINHDGHILWIRVPAKDGAYQIDARDPRLMVPREPGSVGGSYYHVFVEGAYVSVPDSLDQPVHALGAAPRYGLDFNRNFPIRWLVDHDQPGSGAYPLSEPETAALAQFVRRHPNIAAYAALHTCGGVILRQPSTGDDDVLNTTDRELFRRSAQMGERVSGYFARSNYQAFATQRDK
ncbi:MAG: M14 family metallopeptidase, partial [Firmicutes bacterium]|nr:M14 family metallopeptidase [Bacillota bacterium]